MAMPTPSAPRNTSPRDTAPGTASPATTSASADTASSTQGSTGSPGDLLRHARERRGLSLEQISDVTKIPRRHLEAIEGGNLSVVPGEFYRRAEIKTYARAVDVDPAAALAAFDQPPAVAAPETAPPVARVVQPAPAPAGTSSRSRALMALAVVGSAAAIAFLVRGPLSRSLQSSGTTSSVASPIDERQEDRPASLLERTVPDAVATSQTSVEQAATVPAPQEAAPAAPVPPADIPADAPPGVEQTTALVISTVPAGARVTVDGIGWGATPVTIRHLPPGSKHVRVSLDGFEAAEQSVSLDGGQRRALTIRLKERP